MEWTKCRGCGSAGNEILARQEQKNEEEVGEGAKNEDFAALLTPNTQRPLLGLMLDSSSSCL